MDLQGRVALVTGGGIRVGRAVALALAGRGMRIAVHYNASDADARETKRLIEAKGGRAELFAGDLTDTDRCATLVEDVVRTFGQLDVVVNSAAIMKLTPFGEIARETWDEIMAINLRAAFFVAQAAAPHLKRAGGALVNVADLAAYEHWSGYTVHSISKAGIVYMTSALAKLLAPEARVGAVAPGVVMLPPHFDEAQSEHLRETTPLQHHGSADDVARTVLFILDSDYFTGETIIVDGGRHVRT